MQAVRATVLALFAAGLAAPASANGSAAQTLYDVVCASSIGFRDPDPRICNLAVFGSGQNLLTGSPGDRGTDPTTAAFLANVLAGNATAGTVGSALAGAAFPTLLVPLNQDPCDASLSDCTTSATGSLDEPNAFFSISEPSLNILLTQEQQALLGCGEFYGTNCERDGIDLQNAELSAIVQSWTSVVDIPQPCARFVGETVVTLPGCRGPGSVGYDPNVDGSAGLTNPLTGQVFASEIAALSWNALMATVALSAAGDGESMGPRIFDPEMPFRADGCSFAQPGRCATVQALTGVPEPGTALSLGLGLLLLGGRRRA